MATASSSAIGVGAWAAAVAFLPNILKAVILLVVCLILMKILMAASGRLLNKSKLDKGLHSSILSTLKVLLIFMTILTWVLRSALCWRL